MAPIPAAESVLTDGLDITAGSTIDSTDDHELLGKFEAELASDLSENASVLEDVGVSKADKIKIMKGILGKFRSATAARKQQLRYSIDLCQQILWTLSVMLRFILANAI